MVRTKDARPGRGSARGASPPASRTRSKSPARVEKSGRDSAAITRRGRPKKTDTPSEEVSSSSQSSTPKKELKRNRVQILDDSGDNDEVAKINKVSTRTGLRKRLTPINYKFTPTPSEDVRRSISRASSALTKGDSDDESDEVEILPSQAADPSSVGAFSKPLIVFLLLEAFIILPIVLQFNFNAPWSLPKVVAALRDSTTYCNTQSGSFFLAFLTGTVLLSFVPIGRVVTLPGSDVPLKFNGFFSAFVILAFLVGLELRGLDSLTAIYNNIDHLYFLSLFTNVFIAFFLFWRGRKHPSDPNPFATTGKFLPDFAAGLEINPKFYNLFDVKRVAYVRSIILILVINVALLFKNVTIPVVESSSGAPIGELISGSVKNLVFIVQHSEYNCASLIVSGLLVLYAFDLLIFEHHLATSFQSHSEGLGAEILLRFATFPFLLSFLPRFLLIQKLNVNCYLLGAVALIFISALALKRCSSCLKYEYRLRPSDPKFKGENRSAKSC